jgi:hypothetical protein
MRTLYTANRALNIFYLEEAAKERERVEKEKLEEYDRLEKVQAANLAYIELNNIYLQVQRCEKRLSITLSENLRALVGKAYPDGSMADYWAAEFQKLPDWNNF